MQHLCLKCKGRNLCGKPCNLLKSRYFFKSKELNQDNISSATPPTVFVGSKLPYPNVNVGIMSPPQDTENAWIYDAQRTWANNNLGINDIINLRTNLINSRFRSDVYQIKSNNHLLELTQEIGMAINPVEVEIELKQKVRFKLDFDKVHLPMGPTAKLKQIKITENPKIPTKIDKVYSDTDLKAVGAIKYLYKHNFDEQVLTQLLSVGSLGLKTGRKLVPTRWSITSVDDILGKQLISQIKKYNSTEYQAYFGGYLGNNYLILCFPEVYSYELFETYAPKTSWNVASSAKFTTDYESYSGRKTYAKNCAGGFYASRLALLEKLAELRKQSSVLVLRFITEEYTAPLGVWVVREATRKTLANKPMKFSTRKGMIDYAKAVAKKYFNFNLDLLLNESKLIKNIKTQKKLSSFIHQYQ